MLEWEAEDAKREEMEIAKAAMEKYLKGMQYSERFWVSEEVGNFILASATASTTSRAASRRDERRFDRRCQDGNGFGDCVQTIGVVITQACCR